MEEETTNTENGAELARELRAEAIRLGIVPETATDEQLRPLLQFLPKELVEDARSMDDEADAILISMIRLIFNNEGKPGLLN